MRPGESFVGQNVRSLQTMLRVIAQTEDAQPSLIPDGIYGPQTVSAVSAFQRNRGYRSQASPIRIRGKQSWPPMSRR